MAILKMQHISIFGLKKNRKAIIELLQRSGVVEIDDILKEDSIFKKTDMSSAKAIFEKNVALSEQSLSILQEFSPEEKSVFAMFEGKRPVSVENYYTFSYERDEVMRVVFRLVALSKEISEKRADIIKYKTQSEALIPWLALDISMRFKGTKNTASFIGSFPREMTQDAILEGLASDKISAVNVDIVSASKEQTCVFILCSKLEKDAVQEALRAMDFSEPAAPSKEAPSVLKAQLEERISTAEKNIEVAVEEIFSYSGMRNAIKFMADYYRCRADKYEVVGNLVQSKRTFVVTGFIPEKDVSDLEKKLELDYDVAFECREVNDSEEAPILLKNSKFAAPVEGVLESYSLPKKGEIDPTNVMAIFYYILFGMMLSDAAYGLIMVIACGIILLKFKDINEGLKKSLQMFFFCGISTTFWGIMYGSYFGDVVDVVSQTFFGVHLTIPPLWFAPINEPMRLLMFSLLVGVVHVFTGLAMQFVQLVKAKKYKDILYDVIFWYGLVGGLIVVLLSTQMFIDIAQLSFILPSICGTVGGIVAAVSAVGIICTSGRESKNPFKRFLKGLYGLYNVTGYLSDILSYSRLLALGLATGVIATVVNKMGSMAGDGIVGAILFIIVFIAGHLINIGINLLGAYVHTNRLQYVEFFGKFYEGGGRKFKPFAINSKYFKIREETK